MKLRMAKDSIRLRILRSELNGLALGETVHEQLRLAPGPNGLFSYSLCVAEQPDPVQVSFRNGTIQIRLSPRQFHLWSCEDQVGIYRQIDFAEEGSLTLVLEKDCACLDRGAAENQDTFDHPHAGAAC